MQACRRISTIWKTVAVIGMVVFAVSTIRQISGIALADRQSSRGNYHWPAKIPYPKENPYSEDSNLVECCSLIQSCPDRETVLASAVIIRACPGRTDSRGRSA